MRVSGSGMEPSNGAGDSRKKAAKKNTPADPNASGRRFDDIILERLKRLNSHPVHPLDWRTEYFLNHFLGGRRRTQI